MAQANNPNELVDTLGVKCYNSSMTGEPPLMDDPLRDIPESARFTLDDDKYELHVDPPGHWITVDSREARQHPEALRELKIYAAGSEFKPLIKTEMIQFGDYVFSGRELPNLQRRPTIAIECATVADLCGKINSGRLAFQLSNMLLNYDINILMIQGALTADPKGYVVIRGATAARTQFARVWDVLFAAQAHGVIVEFLQDQKHTADRVVRNFNYYNRPYDSHTYFRPQQLANNEAIIPLGEALDRRVQFLMGLPSVGEDRARKLLAEFGTVFNVLGAAVSADGRSLMKVRGIGSKLAYDINKFLLSTGNTKIDLDDNDGEE